MTNSVVLEFDGFTNKETFTLWQHLNRDIDLLSLATQALSAEDPEQTLKDYFTEQSMLLVEGLLPKQRALVLVDIGSLWRVNYIEIIQRLKSLIK